MPDQPVKILVVDDEEGILDFMQRILRFRGYETFGALEGQEALKLFDSHSPSIALIDIQLNDSPIDGIKILERIKQKAPQTVCLMVTRITEPETIDRAKALGAELYLLKPLDTKELLSRVAEAVLMVTGRKN